MNNQQYNINDKQHQFLIGAILGDSHVERNGSNCRITFDHSIKQLQYLQWKNRILQPFCTEIETYNVENKRINKIYTKCRFKTFTLSCFNQYRDLFYKNSKKIVPIGIRNELRSTLALAVWYLDDGSLRSDCKGLRIHTNNFSFKEVQNLKEILKKNFSINANIHKQGYESWNLYIGSANKQSEEFCKIIRYLIASEIPNMLFKLLKPCND